MTMRKQRHWQLQVEVEEAMLQRVNDRIPWLTENQIWKAIFDKLQLAINRGSSFIYARIQRKGSDL